MGMMSKTVEECSRQALIIEDLHSIGKFEIGSNDQSQAFVEFGAEGEKRLSALGSERDEAKFIQYFQIELKSCSDKTVQAMLILSL